MNSYPYTDHEIERQQILSNYHILDTDNESEYEEITELASYICETPVAYIGFIDEQRQWFKSKKGFEAQEVSRHLSICEKCINGRELYQIRDLSTDERFLQHPFVIEEPVKKFYAGIPIVSEGGFVLGTLCVMDYFPKELSPKQVSCLKALAHQLQQSLELRKLKFQKGLEQERILNLNKTSSLGMMTAYMAHEINNSLGILNGYTAIVQDELSRLKGPTDQIVSFVDKIQKTTLRISKVIQGIKSYTRESEMDPYELIELRRLIEETVGICEQKCKLQQTRLSVNLPPEDLKLECHSTQISQVLINLINNGLDAISGFKEKWIDLSVSVASPGSLRFTITDSGPGIPQTLAKKIMEPFFTTKEKGKGTGLGLGLCKSIVEAHHGTFFYDSSSKNTRFGFELPLWQVETGPKAN